MESIFETIFYNWERKKKCNKAINNLKIETENSRKRLSQDLNKKQKRMLLNIVDAKDLINEENNLENFTEEFKLGLSIGYESNKN